MPEPWDIATGVAGYRWAADNPRASLLLQHGYGEYAGRYVERYDRLIPRLVELGLDVYAFDMRGHGSSLGARGVVDVRRAVDDHLAARRAVEKSGAPVFLFGHSLGGLVTAASVARDGRKVAGVVLSAPALLIHAPQAARLIARGLARLFPRRSIGTPQSASGISRDPEEVRLYEKDPLLYRGNLPALLGASAVQVARETWPRYPNWVAPTLVFHGTDDTYTDPRGSRLFAGLIGSPDKRLVIFDRGRHELLNDTERARASEDILSWLDFRMEKCRPQPADADLETG